LTLKKRIGEEKHPLLLAATADIDRLLEATKPFRLAKQYYFEGKFDRASAELDKVNTKICPGLVTKIEQRRKKIGLIKRVSKKIDEVIISCDLATAERLTADIAASKHRLLRKKSADLQRMIQAVKRANRESRAAKSAYNKGDLTSATAFARPGT